MKGVKIKDYMKVKMKMADNKMIDLKTKKIKSFLKKRKWKRILLIFLFISISFILSWFFLIEDALDREDEIENNRVLLWEGQITNMTQYSDDAGDHYSFIINGTLEKEVSRNTFYEFQLYEYIKCYQIGDYQEYDYVDDPDQDKLTYFFTLKWEGEILNKVNGSDYFLYLNQSMIEKQVSELIYIKTSMNDYVYYYENQISDSRIEIEGD